METETCTKSLEWAFVKFMTKIFLKVLTKQASALSLPSPCATVYVTDTYVSLREKLQSQVFIAADTDCNSGASEKHLAGGEH